MKNIESKISIILYNKLYSKIDSQADNHLDLVSHNRIWNPLRGELSLQLWNDLNSQIRVNTRL